MARITHDFSGKGLEELIAIIHEFIDLYNNHDHGGATATVSGTADYMTSGSDGDRIELIL